MKISFLVCAVAASLCAVASAEAQQTVSKTSQRNSRAAATTTTISRTNSPTYSRQQRAAQTRFTPVTSGTDGVIARAARARDKFQMINPAGPAEYGDGRDVTRHEVDDPYQRAQGIKLVTVEF